MPTEQRSSMPPHKKPKTSSSSAMEKPRLYYFAALGRAEFLRQLLLVAGVDFEDITFEWDEWISDYKEKMPFRQSPVLEVEGVQLCQSIPIAKYIAGKYGLAGKTLLESAQCDMIAYTINDSRTTFREICLAKDPEQKAALRKAYSEEEIPSWLEKFETRLKANNGGDGYFVGDSLTYADIMFTAFFHPTPYKGKLDITLDLSPYPKLHALTKRVEQHPKIAERIRTRPDWPF